MKANCIKSVIQAIGRQATQSELDEIESRLVKHMRLMARNDREAVVSMTPQKRMELAATRAARELVYEKERAVLNTAGNVSAKAKIRDIIKANPEKATERMIDILAYNSGGSGLLSLETRSRDISNQALSEMMDAIHAAEPKFLGLFESTEGVEQLFKELHGEDSGNLVAKKGAEQFKAVSESLRQRMNDGGGDIGRLENWTLPNHHSQPKVAAAGMDKWVKDMVGLVDRSKYVMEDGKLFDDNQLTEFLRYSYDSITTGGANKILDAAERGEAVGSGSGSAANRGNASRQIFFKDATAQREYWNSYGDKGLLDIMIGHIHGISRDIALVETLGPNAIANFKSELQYAVAAESKINRGDIAGIKGRAAKAERMLDIVSGNVNGPANIAFSNIMHGIRSINTLKLGSAFITSLSDHATSWLTSSHNKIKYSDVVMQEMNLLKSPEMRDFARRRGLGIDSMLSGLDRMAGDGFESYSGKAEVFAKYSKKMASAVMKASFLQQATDIRRQAFSLTFQDVLGKLTRQDFSSYAADDIAHLTKLGVDEGDWKIWKLAKTEDPRNAGDTMLTTKSITDVSPAQLIAAHPDMFEGLDNPDRYAASLIRNAATKLLGITQDESRMAVVEPGLRTREAMNFGTQSGTIKGEMLNSFWQFKSFGVAMIYSHLMRAASLPTTAGKAAYVSKMVAATTLAGAASYQLSQLLVGKDPQEMDNGKFWMAAFLKGGSFGIYGDFLFNSETKFGDNIMSVIGGPTGQLLLKPFQIAMKEAQYQKDMAFGEITKEPDTAAAALQWSKQLIPGTTLWYVKGAFDHLIWQDLQEMANPGYLDRMKRRVEKDTGQKFWWEGGEALPDRLPDYGSNE